MALSHTTVSADRNSIAAGRDVNIIGIPTETLPAIIAAATGPLERLTGEQRATIAKLEEQLGATREQVLAFFRIIGEAGVPPESMGARLVEVAERHKDLLAQVQAEPGDEPAVARLKAQAHEALEHGDLDRADALLAEVAVAQAADLDRRALDFAATLAQRGEVAMTRLRYREAAGHFAAAAARVPAGHEEQRLGYLDREAEALYRQGDEFGENKALAA